MFDRAAALRQWRLSLLGRGGMTVQDVDELQEHLLELERDLGAVPLAPEERFWLAAHRLGGADELSQEFLLVSPERRWWPRLQWAVLGLLVTYAITPYLTAAVMLLAGLAARLGLPDGAAVVLNAVAPTVGNVVALVALVWAARRWRVTPELLDQALSRASSLPVVGIAALGFVAVAAHTFLVQRVFRLARDAFRSAGLAGAYPPGMELVFQVSAYVFPLVLVALVVWMQRKRDQTAEVPDR